MAKRMCAICEEPIRADSLHGVCNRPGECRKELNRRRWRAHHPEPVADTCRICGGKLLSNNKTGICSRTRTCAREAERMWGANTREAKLERRRAAYAANLQVERDRHRRWLQRPDRPCRHAKAGCTKFATVGQHCCPEHDAADKSRRGKRRRADARQSLATAQGYVCPWCSLPFAADLSDAEIDHIIPVSRGGPDDPWNLQLLHGRCNGTGGKFDQITKQALALVAQHGLVIAALAA